MGIAQEPSNLDLQVRATAFAGAVLTELQVLKDGQKELKEGQGIIDGKVDEINKFIRPAAFVAGAVPTVVAALALLHSFGVWK